MRSRILLLASTWGALAAVSASAQTLADPSATSAPASTIAASPAGVTPTPASTQAATGSVGGDIIVTARKRQESILNVPVIETAIPQARLDKLQVTDLAGVQTLVPGLSLGTAVITIGTQRAMSGRHGRTRATVVPGAMLERTLLDVLAGVEVPLGAYLLSAEARARGRTVPMPSIYRALDRLVASGSIERVESLSAYRIRDKAEAVLMICVQCRRTTSLDVPTQYEGLLLALRGQAFAAAGLALEAKGRCAACGTAPPGDGVEPSSCGNDKS